MIDPNKDTSEEVLQQYKQASYERFRTQFASAVEQKLTDFDMSWDQLTEQLNWGCIKGGGVKKIVRSRVLDVEQMNDLAHVFSCEPYIILRPRLPWINT